MKSLTCLFVVLTLLCFSARSSTQNPVKTDHFVFRWGLTSDSFGNINQNDALAALKVWGNTIIREQGLLVSPKFRFYDSRKELYQTYRSGRLHAINASVEDCLRLGVTPDYIYVNIREDGFEYRYAVVVKRSRAINEVPELKNRNMVLYEGHGMDWARLWLKTLLPETTGDAEAQEFQRIVAIDSPSKAILQVFFQQTDAAVVTVEAFDLACELNPQLRKELLILAESPPLIPSFFMFSDDWQGMERQTIEDAITQLHTTPGGRQVLNVFKSSSMGKLPWSVLDGTRRFLMQNRHLIESFPVTSVQP